MTLDRILLEVASVDTQFTARNNQVSTNTINKKLQANGFNVDVKPEAGKTIPYNNGTGVIPLECKKDASHKLVKDGKFTFNDLKKKFGKDKPEELCKPCADEKGISLKGTGSAELPIIKDLKNILNKMFANSKNVEYKIHGGNSGKVFSDYKTQNSLNKNKDKKLDYDIFIENKNNGQNIAIQVDGPSHNIYNANVEANDMIRATETFKDNKNFFITPHAKEGTPEYNQILQNITEYIKYSYNMWIHPEQSSKMKQMANKVGSDSEAYKQALQAKTEKYEKHVNDIKNSAINRKLYDLVYALLNNNGYTTLNYNGKYNNLVDFLLKDPNAATSFANHRDEWKQLLTTNREATKKWMEQHKSQNPKTFLKLNNGALFENKQ